MSDEETEKTVEEHLREGLWWDTFNAIVGGLAAGPGGYEPTEPEEP